MPEKEPWLVGPGSAPRTQVGSCDRMKSSTSACSGSSDGSYDFLSAEEKACLLFLEETIGSLDTEVDSGLSTDESEQVTIPQAPAALPTTQPTSQGSPEGEAPPPVPEKGSGPEHHGVAQPGRAFCTGSHSLPRNININRCHSPIGRAPEAAVHPAGASEGLFWAPDRKQSATVPAREAVLGTVLIPPPEGFRDTQPELSLEPQLPSGPGQQLSALQRKETRAETMAQRANESGGAWPPSAASSQDRAQETVAKSGSDPETQLALTTAPKSRKLPPNIVLKSSRSSFRGDPHTWLARPSETAPGDSGLASPSLQEQRRARREALEKLGLPQDQQEPGAHTSKLSRLKDPHAPGLAQPAAPTQPTPPRLAPGAPQVTPPGKASAQGSFADKVWTPAQDPAAGETPVLSSRPVPILRSLGARSPPALQKLGSELPLQESGLPGSRQMSFKSKTLERSGVGLSSSLFAEKGPDPQAISSLEKASFLDKTSPIAQHRYRPRPASLGTGKDFAGIQVGKLAELEQEQTSKHLAYQGQSRDKLPRPPCVSVRISPKGVPDEHRREALRKLGLLKE
ncbi:specifically androgen-regulated gene protein [Sorex araneus]|uniref:specifically androgen-regulated gene protein n=1 Tax=Sorex araneus TaxID=42254 RepID=UPI0024339FE6|nr:specifically androgen-regulated gene protein [Sorex araneus]XP_054984649.1 specifically androgen-regulated gene protein [Sorex araneus]